jgi:hypothetical protein
LAAGNRPNKGGEGAAQLPGRSAGGCTPGVRAALKQNRAGAKLGSGKKRKVASQQEAGKGAAVQAGEAANGGSGSRLQQQAGQEDGAAASTPGTAGASVTSPGKKVGWTRLPRTASPIFL